MSQKLVVASNPALREITVKAGMVGREYAIDITAPRLGWSASYRQGPVEPFKVPEDGALSTEERINAEQVLFALATVLVRHATGDPTGTDIALCLDEQILIADERAQAPQTHESAQGHEEPLPPMVLADTFNGVVAERDAAQVALAEAHAELDLLKAELEAIKNVQPVPPAPPVDGQ